MTHTLYRHLARLFPRLFLLHKVKRQGRLCMGRKIDLRHPKHMTDKLVWLSLYDQDPLKTRCADKLLVRQYVQQCGLENLLIPLLGTWDRPEDITFDDLPSQFVLKCNHGCGYNIICSDRTTLDIASACKLLNQWRNECYGTGALEFHYFSIPRRILCEQYVPFLGSSIIDYKIHCLNGKPYRILVCSDRNDAQHQLNLASYSLDWQRLDLLNEENPQDIPCPQHLDEMLRAAEALAKPFPYVRVDFYDTPSQLYFGELTFTPAGNHMYYYKEDTLIAMGQHLTLPRKQRLSRQSAQEILYHFL